MAGAPDLRLDTPEEEGRPMPARWRTRLASFGPPALLLILFWGIGYAGLDFGSHWDEALGKFNSVKYTVDTGLFLQGAREYGYDYSYGGVNYILTWSGFTPEVLRYLHDGPLTLEAFSRAITPHIYTRQLKLRVRAIYLFLCGLSVLWLFCLQVLMRRRRLEAFVAAGILAGSWEVGYHSRWIAPDVVMMQFALLSFVCLAAGAAWNRLRWFYLGAVAVGLVMGTKYPGGLLLPFFVAGVGLFAWRHSRSALYALKHAGGVTATTVLAFLITTPGPVIDPFRFLYTVKNLQIYYAQGWYGYTVAPGIGHFVKILDYFAFEVFSHYWPLSILFAAFAVVGVVSLIREKQPLSLLMIAFAAAYVAYFAQQAALMVRNLLVVVPFLCLAAARGIAVAAGHAGTRRKGITYACIAVALAVNVGWQVYAVHQIRHRGDLRYILEGFADHARRSPREVYLASANLSYALDSLHVQRPANVVTGGGNAFSRVAFLATEGPWRFWDRWPSNWRGMYEATFGAREVNLDAYSTFAGDNQRVIVMTTEHFNYLPVKEQDLVTR